MPFPPVPTIEYQPTPVDGYWRVATHTGTKFFVAGLGWLMTALTGIDDWISYSLGAFSPNAGVGKNDVIVLGGGGGGPAACMYSSDGGASFGSSSMPLSSSPTGMATNGLGKFVAVTGYGAQRCCTSIDGGASWTAQAGFPSSAIYWDGILWDGTYFIAIGENDFDSKIYRTRSLDGVSWSFPAQINLNFYNSNIVTYWAVKGNKVIVIGRDNSWQPAYAYTTNSGSTWTFALFGLTDFNDVYTIAAADDGFIAAGSNWNTVFAYSADGITWLTAPMPPTNPNLSEWSYGFGDIMIFTEYKGAGSGRLWTYGYPVAVLPDTFFHFTFPVTQ